MLVFKIAIYVFIFSLICYLIGFITLGRKSILNEFKKDLLFKLIFGSVVLTTVLAVYITGFRTIYICFLPLIVYMVYHNRFFGNVLLVKFKATDSLVLLLQFFFVITLSFLLIQGDLINGQKALHLDQVFYASLSESIWQTGLETFQSVYLNDGQDIPTNPYHYFELWLTGFSKNTFNVNAVFALKGIVFPFYVFIFFLTIYSFLLENTVKKQKILLILVSIVFLFSRGLFININNINNELSVILFDGCIKNIYPIAFALFSFFLFKEGKISASFIFILLSSLVNIVIFPSMVGGLLLYIFFILVFYKKDIAELVNDKYFIVCIILFFSLFAYYIFFIASSNQETGIQKSIGGLFYNILNNSVFWLNEQFLLIGAVLFFLYKSTNVVLRKIGFLILCIAIVAIFSRALLDNNQNAFQILNAIKFIVNYGLLLILLITLLDYFKSYSTIILNVVIILSVIHFFMGYKYINHNFKSKIYGYTSEYVKEINSTDISNSIGVKIVNASNRPSLQKNPVYIGYCNYMPFIENITTSVVLNIDSLLTEDKPGFSRNINREFIKASFFISQTNYKAGGNIESWNQSVLLYLNKLKPQFCIVDDGIELPIILEQFVSNKIIDKGTGEKFYLLNTSEM
jgi:hypothetical protein